MESNSLYKNKNFHNEKEINSDKVKCYKQNNRKIGTRYEEKAASYLMERGVKILERNFRIRSGEIDIIGLDGNTYIFVEVKYRKSTSYGSPVEAVNYKKQQVICRVATLYQKIKKLPINGSFRFDVISILDNQITWYKNAFPYHV